LAKSQGRVRSGNTQQLGTSDSPIVPATQEAEIRMIVVQGQPGHIVLQTLYQKKKKKKKDYWSGSRCVGPWVQTLAPNKQTKKSMQIEGFSLGRAGSSILWPRA
jgi:hypothetical protein